MSCKRPKFPIDQDPDYEDIIAHQNKRIKLLEKDANEKSIKKIQRIVKSQFAHSIAEKEVEIDMVDQRLNQARMMLDRLRAYIVAGYYSAPEKFSNDSVRSAQTSVHPTIKKMLCGKKPCERLSPDKLETQTSSNLENELKSINLREISNSVKKELKTNNEVSMCISESQSSLVSTDAGRGSRFKVTKKIIVGNTSQYIPDAKREPKDPLIYKWMVYVRAPEGDASIDSFVKKVSFVLHPSFGSNSVVEISKPPFRIIRRGWGEFPIRVQIDFHDPRNKNKTIIHALKFDKAFTGFETLGAETIAEFHIYKPEKNSVNRSNEKTLVKNGDFKTEPDEEKNIEEMELSNSSELVTIKEETISALPLVVNVSKLEENEKLTVTEVFQPTNIGNDNVTIPSNSKETTLTTNENVKVNAITENKTALQPQFTVFPKKSTTIASSKLLSDKIVILSPEVEKKSSGGFSFMANRQEKILVSPSTNLIRTNEPALNKRWTAGVSLLQKTKSKVTANNQQDLTKSGNAVIFVPNSNNNQKKKIFKISADKMLSMNVQNSLCSTISNNNNGNNTVAPVLFLPSTGKTVETNNARPTIKESLAGNNGIHLVKCTDQNGETFLIPGSCLKFPQQSMVIPKTNTSIGAISSSLPTYHVQMIPTSGSTSTQSQLISVNSIKNIFPSTLVSSNAIKSLTQAQNTKLGSLLNNSVLQTRFVTSSAVQSVPSFDIQQIKNHVEIENFEDIDDVIKYFIKFYPIITKSYDKTLHPYCASSIRVFLSWNIGRQRAAEWQRAKAVQKLMKTVLVESNKWKSQEIWSAKKILWWCRRWGFSPMKSETENLNDSEINSKVLLEYSEAKELCNQLDKNQKKINDGKGNYEKEEIVDILSLDESVSTSKIATSPKKDVFERIPLHSTPELQFVQDTVTQIGVRLKPVEITPGVLANIVDEMLLATCKCFMENLTRRSLVQAFKRLGDKKNPTTLILEDVCQCIETVPQFDFLTHKLLGKNTTVDSQFSKDIKEN